MSHHVYWLLRAVCLFCDTLLAVLEMQQNIGMGTDGGWGCRVPHWSPVLNYLVSLQMLVCCLSLSLGCLDRYKVCHLDLLSMERGF